MIEIIYLDLSNGAIRTTYANSLRVVKQYARLGVLIDAHYISQKPK